MDLAKCCLLPSNSGGCSSYRFQVRFDEVASLQEAFRVLKPGGRFAVSEVLRGHVPAEIKKSLELWAGCVAGALSEEDYLEKLAKAGFDQIDMESTHGSSCRTGASMSMT
jgi:ubiquinone/menaquinone biosynthesis C-methylase UbiE